MRLLYCESCQVAEMGSDAISPKLRHDMVQHAVNIMMKASLQLNHICAASKTLAFTQAQMVR